MHSVGSLLLYALSAYGSAPWSTFKQAFNELMARLGMQPGLSDKSLTFLRSRVLRDLEALGHVDAVFANGSSRVYVSPMVLARMPVRGLPSAVLCGMRLESTISDLKKACKDSRALLRISHHPGIPALLPERITVEAASTDDLLSLATSMGATYEDNPPAWKIGEISMSLEDYCKTLEWEAASELTWPRQDFDPAILQFGTTPQSGSRLRLSSYKDPVTTLRVSYLWENGKRARVDRDWGRYAVLSGYGIRALWYQEDVGALCVPASAPLPKYLARAALLCNGAVEQMVEVTTPDSDLPTGTRMNVLRGVPSALADTIARKAGLALERIDQIPDVGRMR